MAAVIVTQSVAAPKPKVGGASPAPAASTAPAATTPGGAQGATQGGSASGLSFESTMLAYQAQAESAVRIADRIDNVTKPTDPLKPPNIILATNADIASIVQLRVVLAQEQLLHTRLTKLAEQVPNGRTFPCKPLQTQPPPKNKPVHTFLAIVPGDVATILQTLATITAVTETSTAASGALADASLVNLVAARIKSGTVFIPSLYAPNALHLDLPANQLGSSALGDALQQLEDDRTNLYDAADAYVLAQCTDAKYKATVDKIAAEIQAASTVVDTFETSLLSGQGPSGTDSPGIATASATPIQQLIYGDLLLTALKKRTAVETYLVSLHALESGGSSLTQSNAFFGSRNYFSGGAVATFSVFNANGTFKCSGVSYAYRGFVQAKDMTVAAVTPAATPAADGSGSVLPGIAHYETTCP